MIIEVTGNYLVSPMFTPFMIKNKKGRIVNISTKITRKEMISYGPSKAAMEAMSTILFNDLKDFLIKNIIICPGGVTDIGILTDEMKENLNKNNISILGPIFILNKTLLFLASPKGKNLTDGK